MVIIIYLLRYGYQLYIHEFVEFFYIILIFYLFILFRQLGQLGNPDTTRLALNVTVRRVLYTKIFNGDALKFMSVLGYK